MARLSHAEPPSSLTASTTVETWLRAIAAVSHSLPDPRPPAPFSPGTRLGQGRFVVGQMIGRGGMGAVYDVHDHQRGVDLALKLLLDTRHERLLAFKNEFRALQDIHHRNLVRLDELFEDEGRWFFTMERVQGIPFVDHARPHARAGGPEPSRLRAALVQLVRGLLALHDADKVHRDVKPSNTLVEAGGRVVLLDFGLVGDARTPHDVLLPGAGTVAYMAPEQVRGASGRPADWYSVGVMLYQSLTGVLPFDGPAHEIVTRKLAEPAPHPAALVAGLPPDLEDLCADLLARDPDQRPDGREILARIEARPHAAAGQTAGQSSGQFSGQFVGRRRELAALRTALDETSRRGATTVLIRGESGIGKTALLDAFVGELRSPALALAGRCYEREFVPFKALDGAIDALARHLDGLDEAALRRLLPPGAALARIFPVLRRACQRAGIAMDDTTPVHPTDERSAAFRALQRLLGALARRGPIVLAIDDLHWADVDSLRALEDVMHSAHPPPILLLLLARSETAIPRLPARTSVSTSDLFRRTRPTSWPAGWWVTLAIGTPRRSPGWRRRAAGARCSWKRCPVTGQARRTARSASKTRWRRGSRCSPLQAAPWSRRSASRCSRWRPARSRAPPAPAPKRCFRSSAICKPTVSCARAATATRWRSSPITIRCGGRSLAACHPSASVTITAASPRRWRSPPRRRPRPWPPTGWPPAIRRARVPTP
jgi:hypothetical protein